jgi:aminopeptidase N
MTDRIAALGCLASQISPARTRTLQHFQATAREDPLVLNKWFAIQAAADLPDLLTHVGALKVHPDFLISNPNRVRSLLSVFAANHAHFHRGDGSGYEFVADCVIELDDLNPQVASRLASSFSQWRRFDDRRRSMMKGQLERIRQTSGLSKDTYEIVTLCLK